MAYLVTNTQIHQCTLTNLIMNRILRLLFIQFLFLPTCTIAQQQFTTTKKKAIKAYQEGEKCYNTFNPKTGMPDYFGAEKNFKIAIKTDANFIEAYIFLGQIYDETSKHEEAISMYKKSLDINPAFYPATFYNIAKIEHRIGKYQDALEHINQYLKQTRLPEEVKKSALRVKESAEFSIKAMQNPVPFNPKNLGQGVNTAEPEYFPTTTADDKTLLFTRIVKDPKAPLGGMHEDFFISERQQDGTWGKAKSISPRINTLYNEGAPSLSVDGQYLIFTACELGHSYGDFRDGYGSCDLFFSRRIGNEWTAGQNLGKPINSVHWETQPCFSADGKTLYFIRGIIGKGGNRTGDIWYSVFDDKNSRWGTPEKLPDVINTPGNEASVCIHPDGQTLYFSSDGHIGMGGLDIFMSRKGPDGNWEKPVNLGYPINTWNDENSLLVSSKGDIAYFASDRPGGYGDLDLYSFELPEHLQPQRTTYLKGIVFDSKTKYTLEAKLELIDLASGTTIYESYSNQANGEFLMSLATNRNYVLNVSKGGYHFYSKNFSLLAKQESSKPYYMEVPLIPIDVADTVLLDNVFFDLNQFTLRPESKIELDKLFDLLQRNGNIKIQIMGHTDSRGIKKDNQILSENRAKAVADYLIQKGIDAKRLTWKGFGDSRPKIPNAQTEEEHQRNRRTEYIIVK